MPVYRFQGITPVVDRTSYVHPTASLIGDVWVGPGCFIGPGSSLRGDFGRISIVGDTSVQDCCVIHTSSRVDCVVGRGATIGHSAVLEGCTVGEHVLIGIHAVVLSGAIIGSESFVGALTLIRQDMEVPMRSLVIGQPARIVRTFTAEEVTWCNEGAGAYQQLAREALTQLTECEPLREAETDRPRSRFNAIEVRLQGPLARARQRNTAPSSPQSESSGRAPE